MTPTFRIALRICLLLLACLTTSPAWAGPLIKVVRTADGVQVPAGGAYTFPHDDPYTGGGVPNTEVWYNAYTQFRIENPGNQTLTLSNPLSPVSGTGFRSFGVTSGSIPPGGQATFIVYFTGYTAGRYFGQVTLNHNAGSPFVIHLAGSVGNFAPPTHNFFSLSSAERAVWEPTPSHYVYNASNCTVDAGNWSGSEGGPLKYFWTSFCLGQARSNPLSPYSGTTSWLDPNAGGSQNHGVLYYGASALGQAFRGTATTFDDAAEKALQILALDLQPTGQGHMRHEAIGQYTGYWEGGVAAMALAGLYAPSGSELGTELLAAARHWWRDHVAALRALRMSDGQVALLGARLDGAAGYIDSVDGLGAAVNLQLLSPQSYSSLHTWIQGLLTSSHAPKNGNSGPGGLDWLRPRKTAERWIVLRAIQRGALETVRTDHPAPCLAHYLVQSGTAKPSPIYRWIGSDQRTHVALPSIYGLRSPGVRWESSWGPVSPHPGSVVRVEAGTANDSGGKGPHKAPSSVVIPASAQVVIDSCI